MLGATEYKWCDVPVFKNMLWNLSFIFVFGKTKKKNLVFFKPWYLFFGEIFQASLPSSSKQDPLRHTPGRWLTLSY